MKKILIIGLTIMGLATGCSLDEPNYGKTTTDNFYKKESGVKYALTGAYLQLRTTWNEYSLNHYFMGDCSTDDALKGGGDDGDRREVLDLGNFSVQTTNGEVGRRWEILYRLINRCNDVIYYAADAEGDKDMLKRYENEARALRAYGYYQLVTTFGGVPLMTTPLTPNEMLQVARSSKEDVYTLIEQDLRAAMTLPSKSEYHSEDAYRVSRGFAKTMLAKMYMFQRNFVAAETVLKEIVETDKDYTLLPDYGMNWRREYENSTESVFEISNKMMDKEIATGTNVPHYFSSRRVPGYQGYGFHVPSKDLYDEFDPQDPRITYVFTQSGDQYVGDAGPQDNTESQSGYHDYKMTVPTAEKVGYDVWMIPYNIRLIRYSDVLLLYAEALNENGKGSQALTYVNEVRTRARSSAAKDPRRSAQAYLPNTNKDTSLPNITTTNPDDLRKAIWHERRCELAMEGWRRDDLMRQQRFGEVMKSYSTKYNTDKGRNFSDSKDYLLPIPQGERDRTNGLLTQNPEY